MLGSSRCTKGSPFHTEGPTTKNARAWVVEVRAKEQKVTPVPMSGVNCDLWCVHVLVTADSTVEEDTH